jgi:hypothetical protein
MRRRPIGAAAAAVLLLAMAHGAIGCALVAGLSSPDTSPSKQHCVDGVKDADEVDIDCGGKDCLACAGAACSSAGECQSDGCVNGTCSAPTCSDGVFDGYESSLDCGDPRGTLVGCPLCDDGSTCFNGCNCTSGFCDPGSGTCAVSPEGTLNCDFCKDGVKDGMESDVDCGGTTCPACAAGKHCGAASDCASMACSAGVCG